MIDDLASIGEPGVRNLVKTGQECWTCKACGARSMCITGDVRCERV